MGSIDRAKSLRELEKRRQGIIGKKAHDRTVDEQKQEEANCYAFFSAICHCHFSVVGIGYNLVNRTESRKGSVNNNNQTG